MDTAERIIALCKEKKIPVSTLEKSCGFANAYIRGRIGGKIPPDRVKIIAEYLHVHPSEIDPSMFSSEYSNPKYDGVVRRLSEDPVFEDVVLNFYNMSSDEISTMENQFKRLSEYVKQISNMKPLRIEKDA